MAQYRSQWTGEVIDDAVGKAKNITYLTIGVDAHDSYQKAGAAFGQSPLYARELLDGDERLYICTYRIDLLGLGYIYYFEYANGSASIYWTLQSSEWSGPVKDSYPTIEYLSKSLGFYENSQTASRNYTKGQYIVWDVAYEYGNRLYVADVDISAGTTLKKSGLNKNLTAVPDGGLNDLKSAINSVQDDIAIRVVGNKTTYATGAAIGQYVIVDGSTITGISDGLYKAAKVIPYNTVIDSTYLTAVSGGGLNELTSAFTQQMGGLKISTFAAPLDKTSQVNTYQTGITWTYFAWVGLSILGLTVIKFPLILDNNNGIDNAQLSNDGTLTITKTSTTVAGSNWFRIIVIHD